MSQLMIRQMDEQDLDTIKDVLQSDFDDFWNYDTLHAELQSPLSHYFVICSSDSILGFAGVKFVLEEAELMNIVTKKSQRNQKIASQLLRYIIDYCKRHEKKFLNLEVNEKNTIAIHFYKKYNFNQVGLRKKYYHHSDAAILMTLSL